MKLKIRRAVLDEEGVFRARHERVVTEKDLREKLKDRLKENNKKYYEWAEKVKKNPDDHYKQGKCWEYEGCCEEDRELLAELEKEEK